MASDKQHAHQLLDQLDPGQLSVIVRLLEVMTDPVARSLANAPIEDEVITPEEITTVEASKAWLQNHRPIPHEEVLAELGLSTKDFEQMMRTPIKPADTNH